MKNYQRKQKKYRTAIKRKTGIRKKIVFNVFPR